MWRIRMWPAVDQVRFQASPTVIFAACPRAAGATQQPKRFSAARPRSNPLERDSLHHMGDGIIESMGQIDGLRRSGSSQPTAAELMIGDEDDDRKPNDQPRQSHCNSATLRDDSASLSPPSWSVPFARDRAADHGPTAARPRVPALPRIECRGHCVALCLNDDHHRSVYRHWSSEHLPGSYKSNLAP